MTVNVTDTQQSMPDMAATCGWFTQQSTCIKPTNSTAILCHLCLCHQVENIADIPNNSSQVFSMVNILAKKTPLKNTTLKITIFPWLPQTVTDAYTPSLTKNKISCYQIHDMAVTNFTFNMQLKRQFKHSAQSPWLSCQQHIHSALNVRSKTSTSTPGHHFQHGWSSSDELFKWHISNNQNHRLLQVIRQAAVYAMHSCDQHCVYTTVIQQSQSPDGVTWEDKRQQVQSAAVTSTSTHNLIHHVN